LYTWGYNAQGALGLGNTTNYSSPQQVGVSTSWTSIAGGPQSIAIKTDGTLWTWGKNLSGQLGLGNTIYYSSPRQVGALTNWLSAAAGYSDTFAIKTDGTLWGWGSNGAGTLGLNNPNTDYSSPRQVGALTNWKNIAGGNGNAIAVKTDGTLWSWGQNQYGQLGLNTSGAYTNQNSPVQVGNLSNWLSAVAGGNAIVAAIKTDGTLWTWGLNNYGQLGLGNRTNYSSPVQIGALTSWKKISLGFYHSTAIKTDGTLWSWGANSNGQLGLGNITNYSSPVQVGALTTWQSLGAGGAYFTSTLKTDGTLWTWGSGYGGELGLNSTISSSSPLQVGALTSWIAVANNVDGIMAIHI